MLGAIIGDIAGSKYEFNNTFDYDFEMFGEGRFGIPQDMKEKAVSFLPDEMREISARTIRLIMISRCSVRDATSPMIPSVRWR